MKKTPGGGQIGPPTPGSGQIGSPTPGGGQIGSHAEQPIPDWLQSYVKAYPKVKAFIVTSDRMIFLPRQSGEATAHQKALNSKNERTDTVQIYKRPSDSHPGK